MTTNITEEATSSRDPFGLSRLPHPAPASDAWPDIRAALLWRQRVRRLTVWLASAAMVTLTIGIWWQTPGMPTAGTTEIPATGKDPMSAQVSAGGKDSLESLVSLSQKLERNLRLMRAEVGVVPAQSLIYQVELEDRVAQIDEAINHEPDSRELWSQRVNLLLDLNQLTQQQLRREYRQLASL